MPPADLHALLPLWVSGDSSRLAQHLLDPETRAAFLSPDARPRLLRALLRSVHQRNQFVVVDDVRVRELDDSIARAQADVAAGSAENLAALHDLVAAHLRDRVALLEDDAGAPRPVTAGTYAASLQLDVLGLDAASLRGPVLDVGCGADAVLVAALRARGLDAIGIDRYLDHPDRDGAVEVDWLTYPYAADHFATIVSHLALSLHFLHHHASGDTSAVAVARAFASLTRALAPGGVLAYVPGLPMFERALDRQRFEVARVPIPHDLEAGLAALSAAVGEDIAYAAQVRRR